MFNLKENNYMETINTENEKENESDNKVVYLNQPLNPKSSTYMMNYAQMRAQTLGFSLSTSSSEIAHKFVEYLALKHNMSSFELKGIEEEVKETIAIKLFEYLGEIEKKVSLTLLEKD